MLLCLLFAPALHTRMKRRRSVPESINRRFSFRLLNTVTRPTHLGESAKKAKTFIGRVSLLPSREKKKERKRKDSRPNTNLLSFSNWFSSNGKKRKNYYLSPITSRWYDYPPPPPLHLLHCQLQRQRELSATRRTEEPEAKNPPPCFYLGVTNFSPRWLLTTVLHQF